MTDAADAAYADAVKMLSRRELSEAQIRQRLGRRGHSDTAIESAVARLREARAIDDVRVAEAIARNQIATKRRGRRRAEQQIVQAGISPDTARSAARTVSESLDTDALLEASLARRLRGVDRTIDRKEFARLYRYLVGQGFESDRVLAVLKKHERTRDDRNK
jgi:regulatory protein